MGCCSSHFGVMALHHRHGRACPGHLFQLGAPTGGGTRPVMTKRHLRPVIIRIAGLRMRPATGRREAWSRAHRHGGRRPAILDGQVRDQESGDKAPSNVMIDAVPSARRCKTCGGVRAIWAGRVVRSGENGGVDSCAIARATEAV